MPWLIPFMAFADGRYENGMLSADAAIYDNACENPWSCEKRTTRSAILTGTSDLKDYGVEATDADDGGWLFGSTNSEQYVIAANGMYGGIAKVTRNGDRLEQAAAEGSRTYVSLPEELQTSALDLAAFLGRSPMPAYTCSLERIVELDATPEDQRSQNQRELQAFLNHVAFKVALDNQYNIRVETGLTDVQETERTWLETQSGVVNILDSLANDLVEGEDGTVSISPVVDETAQSMLLLVTLRGGNTDDVNA